MSRNGPPEREEAMVASVESYCRVIRGQRRRSMEHSAEIASRCATGAEAAQRIREELARTHSEADDNGEECRVCGSS